MMRVLFPSLSPKAGVFLPLHSCLAQSFFISIQPRCRPRSGAPSCLSGHFPALSWLFSPSRAFLRLSPCFHHGMSRGHASGSLSVFLPARGCNARFAQELCGMCRCQDASPWMDAASPGVVSTCLYLPVRRPFPEPFAPYHAENN